MNRIEEIYKNIEELKKEIEYIQKSCNHSEYRIGLFSWRIGSSSLKRICIECNSILSDPTDEEVSDYNCVIRTLYNEESLKIGSKIYKS
jgi:hypothetical protein